jgi:hypothetical protein
MLVEESLQAGDGYMVVDEVTWCLCRPNGDVPYRARGGEDGKLKELGVHLLGAGHFGPMLRWHLCLETSSGPGATSASN